MATRLMLLALAAAAVAQQNLVQNVRTQRAVTLADIAQGGFETVDEGALDSR